MFEWGDIRYFLAVARSGSTLAAAGLTGSSQSTVTRRLALLEQALDLKLFERLQSGSRLTDQGETLLAQAEAAEQAMQALADAAAVARRRLSGIVRLTTSAEAAEPLVAGPLTAFMKQHPGVKVEVLLSEQFLDIAAGQADVALRAGSRPTDPALVVRKIMDIPWGGFCSPAYFETHGAPTSYDELRNYPVIGPEGPLAEAGPLKALARHVTEFAFRSSSINGMLGYARGGLGIALMPLGLGENQGLVHCLPNPDTEEHALWLITREDIRQTPHVRAFIDFLVGHLVVLARQHHANASTPIAASGITPA